jgi:uncharacterized membrane protein
MIWESENLVNQILEYLGPHLSLVFLASIFPHCNCDYTSLLYSIPFHVSINLKWIRNSFQCPNQFWLTSITQRSTTQYCDFQAAKDGNITALTWILLKELQWSRRPPLPHPTSPQTIPLNEFPSHDWILSILKIAFAHNHLKIFHWVDNACSTFPYSDIFLCSDAVTAGNHEMALWLSSKGCLWEKSKGQLLSDAILSNELNTFDWLIEHQNPLPKISKLCTMAVQYDRLEMLEKLLKASFPLEEQAIYSLIEQGNLTLLSLIRSYKPIPISEKSFDLAVVNGRYEVIDYFRGSIPFSGGIDYLTQPQRLFCFTMLTENWLWNFLSACPPSPDFLQQYQRIIPTQISNMDPRNTSASLYPSFLYHVNILEKFLQRLHYCIHASRIMNSLSTESPPSSTLPLLSVTDQQQQQQQQLSVIQECDLRGIISFIQLESTYESYQVSLSFLREHLEEMINWIHSQTNYTVSWITPPLCHHISPKSSAHTWSTKKSFKIFTDVDSQWVKMTPNDCHRRIQSLLAEYKTNPSIDILSEMSLFGIPIQLDENHPELSPEQLMIKCISLSPLDGKYYARLHMWMTGSSCQIENLGTLTRQQILAKALELSPRQICVLYAAILSLETNQTQRLQYQKLCYDLTGGSQSIHYFIKFAGSTPCPQWNKSEILDAIHTLYYFEFNPPMMPPLAAASSMVMANVSHRGNGKSSSLIPVISSEQQSQQHQHQLIHQDHYCRFKGNYKYYFCEVFCDLLYRLSLLMESNEKVMIHDKEYSIQSLHSKCCELVGKCFYLIKKRLFRVYQIDENQKLLWNVIYVTGDLCFFRKALRCPTPPDSFFNLHEYGLVLATGFGLEQNYQQVRESIRLRYGLEYFDCENIWKQCANQKSYQLEKRK